MAGAAHAQPSTAPFPSAIELSSLLPANGGDGSVGFVLNGVDQNDVTGAAVGAAGDINGDGFADVVIGAPGCAPAGCVYVLFGGVGVGSSGEIELSSLNGANGFIISGVGLGDRAGQSVAGVGDVNGDGIDDLIIGAMFADPGGLPNAGESYVVYGAPGIGAGGSLDVASLDGSNGFAIAGDEPQAQAGFSVASAGDFNGDGYADVIVGAKFASPAGKQSAGESFVVFGGPAVGGGGVFDLGSIDGANGVVIKGITPDDQSGRAVSGGADVNGDGFDDVVIGAYQADPAGQLSAGEAYVVFGAAQFNPGGVINLFDLDGSNGFELRGKVQGDLCGRAVASPGDVDGDGYPDVLVGARAADPQGRLGAGETYLIFGGPSVGASGVINVASLNGTNGLKFNGIDAGDESGDAVGAAGDINGDGIADLVIGALRADPNGASSGESYMVFGTPSLTFSGINIGPWLSSSGGFTLRGIDASDLSGYSVSAAGDINGDGVDDVIVGAQGADPGGDSSAGEAYIIFGRLVDGRVWDDPFGGDVSLASNWVGGAVPGASDSAVIDNTIAGYPDATFTLVLPGDQDYREFLSRTDIVTINLNENDLSLGTGSSLGRAGLTVGGRPDADARLVLSNGGLLRRTVSTDDAIVGPVATDALLSVTSSLSVTDGEVGLDIMDRLIVGQRARQAECLVTNGADVTVGGSLVLGDAPASSGTLRIADPGSELDLVGAADRVAIGRDGDATLEILAGGVLRSSTFLQDAILAETELSSASVLLDGGASQWISLQSDLVVGAAGAVTMEIRDGAQLRTDTTNQLVVARDAGSTADILIDGAGSSWTELTQSVIVGGDGAATIRLANGATLGSQIGINVNSGGTIGGDGTLNPGDPSTSVTSVGLVAPGSDTQAGTLQVGGSFQQRGLSPSGTSVVSGALELDVFGADPNQRDQLVVDGNIELAGSLRVSFAPGFQPDPELLGQLDLVSASTNFSDSRFDVALLPGLSSQNGSFFFSVDYPPAAARDGGRSSVAVSLSVNTLTGDVELDSLAAGDSGNAGLPAGAALADIDGQNGPDLLIALPDPVDPEGADGSLVILYNGGVDGVTGDWNGFTGNPVVLPVGRNPSGVAVGQIDDDPGGQVDIAVSNLGDDEVTIILVGDPDQNAFTPAFTIDAPVGVAPADLIIDDLDGDGANDIATADSGSDSVSIVWNSGTGIGPLWDLWPQIEPISLPDDSECPVSIRPGDGAGLRFLATANAGNDTIGLIPISARGTNVAIANLPAGAEPVELVVRDLDGDLLDDIATVNRTGDSISVALNQTVGAVLDIGPSSDLPLASAAILPSSITAGDFDNDGDAELAVLADSMVKVLRNDLAGGQLAFVRLADQAAGTNPLLVRSGDLDGDGRDDVVGVSESTGAAQAGALMPTNEPINALLTLPPPAPACAGDVNGDGTTDVFDFSDLAANFGAGPGATLEQGDLTGDGFVDVFDFGELAADFGCGVASPQ